jgi:hypothetical protein
MQGKSIPSLDNNNNSSSYKKPSSILYGNHSTPQALLHKSSSIPVDKTNFKMLSLLFKTAVLVACLVIIVAPCGSAPGGSGKLIN